MKILVVKPYQKPEVIEIDHTLKAMQAVVGGYIEAVYPFDDEVAIVVNEEGKINGLPLNRFLFNDDGNLIDIIVGTFFICGAPSDSDSFADIPDELINKYTNRFC